MTDIIPIVTDKEKLSIPCDPVSEEEGRRIGELLVSQLKLRSDYAVGLAANQIGINARVFAIRVSEEYLYFVNPVILERSDLELFRDEGCLSLPGQKINTVRFSTIKFKDDANYKNENHYLKNFGAIAFQHELDHLDGVLMTERESSPYKLCPCGSGKKFKFCHMR